MIQTLIGSVWMYTNLKPNHIHCEGVIDVAWLAVGEASDGVVSV